MNDDRLVGFNNHIACTPFASKGTETKTMGGMVVISQKAELSSLKVIWGDSEGKVSKGSTVYVNGTDFKQSYGTKVFNLNGQEFILVPLSAVLLVEAI